MRQSKQVKPRECKHCKQRIETDAAGIRAHAEECQKKGKKETRDWAEIGDERRKREKRSVA